LRHFRAYLHPQGRSAVELLNQKGCAEFGVGELHRGKACAAKSEDVCVGLASRAFHAPPV